MLKILTLLMILNSCSTTTSKAGHRMDLTDLSHLSTNPLYRGGFSGLQFEMGDGDELTFLAHSDRGPNAEPLEVPGKNIIKRPFFKPDFQPFWIKFSVNRRTKEVWLKELILLTLPDGSPMTGMPNKVGDEVPITLLGNELPLDVHGIDPESICFDGNYIWMGEEYGPSILKFNLKGTLLSRYVPEGSYSGQDFSYFRRTLPRHLLDRKVNRGFEALTCQDGKVYSMLQSPIKGEGKNVRIFEFNPLTEKVEREFFYPLDSDQADKIGDLATYGKSLLVLEQNGKTGKDGIHKIYKINLQEVDERGFLKKILVKDLVAEGYSFAEKVEGLTVINGDEIAVVNDDDFGVNDSSLKTILGILKINR